MNLEQARFNMVEQQVRTACALDGAVCELIRAVKREAFVPPAWRKLAFADMEIPLGFGAAMLPPRIEARALQALGVGKRERVLEIGTGSGYMAALLAMHAERVWSVEIVPQLAEAARANLRREGVLNVSVETGDGVPGLPASAPFDAIMVSGGLAVVPRELLAQLKVGGRMFAIVGRAPAMTAQLIVREANDAFRTVGLFETQVALLQNAPALPGFVF